MYCTPTFISHPDGAIVTSQLTKPTENHASESFVRYPQTDQSLALSVMNSTLTIGEPIKLLK